MTFPIRPRRLRNNTILREGLADISINKEKLIIPVFVIHGTVIRNEIQSMPGIYHLSLDELIKEVKKYLGLGLNKILVFGHPEKKDFYGSSASDPEEIVPMAIRELKKVFGSDLLVIADVCLCAYTTHGHCGIPDDKGQILNDISVTRIAETALTYAQAGADVVAPSDMMDGRIKAIRDILDENQLFNTMIMSYAIKFASSYYGPFREAADSAPQFGDRQTYQLSYKNARLALREIELDEKEGADTIMVKPALPYLDIIFQAHQMTKLPIVAYNVSGEYSMVKFAGKAGSIDEVKVALENLSAIFRAGADLVITYHGSELVERGFIK